MSVPTVLFFPALRNSSVKPNLGRSDTRVFPANKPFNVANLLNFIIVNLPHSSRAQLALNLCDDRCTEISMNEIKKQLSTAEDDSERETETLNENAFRKFDRLYRLKSLILGNTGKDQQSDQMIGRESHRLNMKMVTKDEL